MDDMELGGLEQVPALSGRVLRYAMIMIIKYGNDGEEKVNAKHINEKFTCLHVN